MEVLINTKIMIKNSTLEDNIRDKSKIIRGMVKESMFFMKKNNKECILYYMRVYSKMIVFMEMEN